MKTHKSLEERLEILTRERLFTEARTARYFSSKSVEDDELRNIWDMVKWAPTASNSQPLRVTYVRTCEGRSRLIDCLADGNKDKAKSAPVCAILAMDSQFHEFMPVQFPFRPELREFYEDDVQVRLRDGEFNSALQAGYFILAVRAAGLAAGPMAGFDALEVDKIFFPDGRFRSILIVNIGHPAGGSILGRLPRLGNDETLTWL